MALRFATGLVLDEFVCDFSQPISFEQKKQKLSQIKRSCDDAIVSKIKIDRLKDAKYLCVIFLNYNFQTLKERAR
jgi:hypothetical protein